MKVQKMGRLKPLFLIALISFLPIVFQFGYGGNGGDDGEDLGLFNVLLFPLLIFGLPLGLWILWEILKWSDGLGKENEKRREEVVRVT
jgi:hypothetical protein